MKLRIELINAIWDCEKEINIYPVNPEFDITRINCITEKILMKDGKWTDESWILEEDEKEKLFYQAFILFNECENMWEEVDKDSWEIDFPTLFDSIDSSLDMEADIVASLDFSVEGMESPAEGRHPSDPSSSKQRAMKKKGYIWNWAKGGWISGNN